MAKEKEFLNEEDFKRGLLALDSEMGQDPWLIAFSPIRIVTAGGFFAVTYLKNRDTTGDIDYLMDPEFVADPEVKQAFKDAIRKVGRQLQFNLNWANDAMGIFVTKSTLAKLFHGADEQNITLFKGDNLEVLAAPIEWALERKLRRIYGGERDRKAELDMGDAIAMLKVLRGRASGPLEMETIRAMNANGFDVLPDIETMERVAREYRQQYDEEVFK